MEIKDLEVLIECKRLVEKMLIEKKYVLSKLEESDKGDERAQRVVIAQISRMERALEGKPSIAFYDQMWKREEFY